MGDRSEVSPQLCSAALCFQILTPRVTFHPQLQSFGEIAWNCKFNFAYTMHVMNVPSGETMQPKLSFTRNGLSTTYTGETKVPSFQSQLLHTPITDTGLLFFTSLSYLSLIGRNRSNAQQMKTSYQSRKLYRPKYFLFLEMRVHSLSKLFPYSLYEHELQLNSLSQDVYGRNIVGPCRPGTPHLSLKQKLSSGDTRQYATSYE